MTSNTFASAPLKDAVALDPLSAQDRLFLLAETKNSPMHVGAALVFDGGPLSTPAGSVDFARVRRHIAARLNAVPRYRQRVEFTPLRSRPHWVDAERFDIDHHVRHLRLPHPGTEAQLKQLCGQLFSEQLDRDRPLWELYVIEGLKGGRFALVAKTHHCLVDGIGGVHLLAALLDPVAEYREERPEPWSPRRPPSARDALQLELRHQLDRSLALGRQLRGWAQAPAASTRKLGEQVLGVSQLLGTSLWPASECVLNRPIGAQRRFEWLTLELADVKQVKEKFGATINDVVLATIAGAMRQFLRGRPGSPRPTDLRTLVPVNMRQTADDGLGNHISALLVSLPLGITDPRRRLLRIAGRMRAVKATKQAQAGQIVAGTGVPLLATLMRFADRLKAFNLVVTNVPGPPIPLYLAGAPLAEMFPQVPLFLNQGLGIALFSYAGKLYWGLNADRDVLPDIADLKRALLDSFDELHALTERRRPRRKSNVLTWAPRAQAS